MKLYKYQAPSQIKVLIQQKGEDTITLSFIETNKQIVYDYLIGLLSIQKISAMTLRNKTQCVIREFDEKWVGKSICVSVYGFNPKELKELIIANLIRV